MMKSVSAFTLAAATALLGAYTVSAQTYYGCFSSTDSLTFNQNFTFNSRGKCGGICSGLQMAVTAMTGEFECYCGPTLPPSTDQVSNSSCNTACPGYPSDTCGGGTMFASAYMTSTTATSVDFANGGSSDGSTDPNDNPSTTSVSPSATASSKPSVVTSVIGGQTVFVTASSTATAANSGGPSKAGIAAGVVVGLVAIAAIVGGIFLFIKNRRKRAIEEEYRRNAAVSSFMAGGGKHPPNSSGGGSSFTDMRLDPAVMAQRRMSDGSIADNQDYSRRILKVTNA